MEIHIHRADNGWIASSHVKTGIEHEYTQTSNVFTNAYDLLSYLDDILTLEESGNEAFEGVEFELDEDPAEEEGL